MRTALIPDPIAEMTLPMLNNRVSNLVYLNVVESRGQGSISLSTHISQSAIVLTIVWV